MIRKIMQQHKYRNTSFSLRCEALEYRWVLANSLIGVDFDASGSSPTNWNNASAAMSGLVNAKDESGANTTVSMSITSNGSRADGGASPPSFQIPIHANPLDLVDGNIYADSGDTLTFEWFNLTPGTRYDVYHFGSDEVSTNSQITIAGAGAPIVFTRGFVGNDLAVNDELGDDTRTLKSYAETVAATATGTITITVEALVGDAGTAGLAIQESFVDGDFNDDGLWSHIDIDSLVAKIVDATDDPLFDLTGDGLVNVADRDAWLSEAGAINLGPGRVYLIGDANLDSVVDGQDFIVWNVHKFLANQHWSGGDFTADGVTDGQDFIAWNNNKFMSSSLKQTVSQSVRPSARMADLVFAVPADEYTSLICQPLRFSPRFCAG